MERAVPVLPGDSISVAREFFVERLGFSVRFEATEDGINGLLGVQRGDLYLTIDCPMSGHGRNACAVLEVDDADALYEDWKQRVEIKRSPIDEPWGGRTFGVTDPFGNSIFIIGPVRQPAGSQ